MEEVFTPSFVLRQSGRVFKLTCIDSRHSIWTLLGFRRRLVKGPDFRACIICLENTPINYNPYMHASCRYANSSLVTGGFYASISESYNKRNVKLNYFVHLFIKTLSSCQYRPRDWTQPLMSDLKRTRKLKKRISRLLHS